MPDEVAILRAAGQEQAAQILEASRAGAVAAQPPAIPPQVRAPEAVAPPAPVQVALAAPEIPAAPMVPAPVADAVAQRGPQPPPGKAPLTIADLSTISQGEAVERMDEIETLERQEQDQRRAS